MSDGVKFEVDSAALVSALRDFPDVLQPRVKAACRVSAGNILTEGQRRIRRRTGRTGDRMRVDETYKGDGYVVVMGDAVSPDETRRRESVGGSKKWVQSGSYNEAHVGLYLEFGTRSMAARPFLFAAGDLEVNAHDRRVRDAIEAGIREKGFG